MSYKRQLGISIPQSDVSHFYFNQNNILFRYCNTDQSTNEEEKNDSFNQTNNYLSIENNLQRKYNKIKQNNYRKTKKVVFNNEVEVFDIEKWKKYNLENTSTIQFKFIPKNKNVNKFINNSPRMMYKKRLNIRNNKMKRNKIIAHKDLYMNDYNNSTNNIFNKRQIDNTIKNENAPKCDCIVF